MWKLASVAVVIEVLFYFVPVSWYDSRQVGVIIVGLIKILNHQLDNCRLILWEIHRIVFWLLHRWSEHKDAGILLDRPYLAGELDRLGEEVGTWADNHLVDLENHVVAGDGVIGVLAIRQGPGKVSDKFGYKLGRSLTP
jgi:hypothetical protein